MEFLEFALHIAAPLFGAVRITIPQGRELTAEPETTEPGIGKTLAFREDGNDGTTVVHVPSGGTARFGVNGREIDVADRTRGGHRVEIHEEEGIAHTLKLLGQRIELTTVPDVIVANEGPTDNENFPVIEKPKKK